MKYSIFSLFLALIVFSCGGPEGEKVDSGEAVDTEGTTVAAAAYTVDPAQSVINWKGSKLVGGGHEGTIDIQSGRIAISNGNIVGGEFVIDMTSISNTDLDDNSGKGKLEGHLKSPDFFAVEQHPTAKFTIASAQPVNDPSAGPTHRIIGNLTMRDSTRSVAIPVIVKMDGDMLKASAPDFVIDRTEWGVEYGSGSLEGIAKDNIINDNIGLSMVIVAKQ